MKKFNEFLNEAKDDGEYGQQGGMAKSQLRMIMSAAKRLHDSLKDDDVLPGHIIANIVLASDYVTGSADYMQSEMDDEEYDDDEMDDMDEEVEQLAENPFNQRLQKAPGGETLPAPAKGTVEKHGRKFKEGDMVVPHTGPHAGVPHKVTTARAGTVNIHPMVSVNKHKYDNTTIRAKHEHLSPYKGSVKEEVEFAEEQMPAYHYYATKNGIGAKEMKLTHSKGKPFTSENDAFNHIVKTGGRQSGIIHKVNSATGKVVQHRGVDGGQKGYPTPASDMPGDAPKHVRDLKEEVEGSVKRNREMFATGRISKDEFDRRMGYGKYKNGQPAGVGPLGKSLYKNLTKSVVEEVKLDEVSTEKLRDYTSAALQDKNKAKADKRWKYAAKAIDKVAGRDVKAAHALKYNKNEEVELDEASDLRITKVYNKFPKKATYAVHSADRKYYKEFDNEAAAKAHHAEKSGK